jgi:hypothetical protein
MFGELFSKASGGSVHINSFITSTNITEFLPEHSIELDVSIIMTKNQL